MMTMMMMKLRVGQKVISTNEDEDTTEDGIPVSATQGDGVEVLWDRIQEKVLQATSNKHIVFTVPTDGPQLR